MSPLTKHFQSLSNRTFISRYQIFGQPPPSPYYYLNFIANSFSWTEQNYNKAKINLSIQRNGDQDEEQMQNHATNLFSNSLVQYKEYTKIFNSFL